MNTPTQRKRGRPKGSKNKPKASKDEASHISGNTHTLLALPIAPNQDNQWFPRLEDKEAALEVLHGEYQRQIRNSIERLGDRGDNHITSITVAHEIMVMIIRGDERIVVIAPTLSGKTSIMKSLAKMAQAVMRIRSLQYHCGVNYLENRRQTTERLAIEKVRICSLRDRRRSEPIVSPSLTIYDETQVAQKPDQTLASAFKRSKTFHTKGSVTVAFSATPNSVLAGGMFSQLWVPLRSWIDQGYCDIQHLIDSGRLKDADPIFIPQREGRKRAGKLSDWLINTEANALTHLKEILSSEESRNGFALIRLPRKHGQLAAERLLQHLVDEGLAKFASHVFYTEANPELGPNFFKSNPVDKLCIVFLKNKLSVGVDLDTRWIKMFYEYSPNTTVETFAQAAAGRVAGWNKKAHKCVVYTSLTHAQVYSVFIHQGWEAYLLSAKQAGLRISAGAKIVTDFSREVVDLATYHFPDEIDLEKLKRVVKDRILQEHGLKVDTTRTLSETKFQYGRKKNPIWTPYQPAKDFRPSNTPGTVTVNILNRYHPSLGRSKNWDGAIVRAVRTTDRVLENCRAEPYQTIHSPEFFV